MRRESHFEFRRVVRLSLRGPSVALASVVSLPWRTLLGRAGYQLSFREEWTLFYLRPRVFTHPPLQLRPRIPSPPVRREAIAPMRDVEHHQFVYGCMAGRSCDGLRRPAHTSQAMAASPRALCHHSPHACRVVRAGARRMQAQLLNGLRDRRRSFNGDRSLSCPGPRW